MVSLTTNLALLPLQTTQQLANCLNNGSLWLKILDSDKNSTYYMSNDDVDRYMRQSNPGEALLRLWGNRGEVTRSFLERLQSLSKHHGAAMDPPQLVLNRKFKEVRWSRKEQVLISLVNDDTEIQIECKAIGFPWPLFRWHRNDESVEGSERFLVVPRCSCSAAYTYRCSVSNEIADGFSYSAYHRREGKQFQSLIESNVIDIASFVGDKKCDSCRDEDDGFGHIREIVGKIEQEDELLTLPQPHDERVEDQLIASDKVALIISNCQYRYLPELVTPHCDAEVLAMELQEMKYKTVTLADLTLEEMKFIIKEYRKLLGRGVYAVFYFVGHGFEVNGQCYLLPIEAPMDAHHPQFCLSIDWVLATLRDYECALNLLLLDVCRKFIPLNYVADFVNYAEQFKAKHRPNRNTVYGYSTSTGVGAYEVRGEVNGVFMKYLKSRIRTQCSVLDMLNMVLRDIEEDKKVCDVQVPELRSTLTRPRSLQDHLIYDGHTVSFDHHTIHWRLMHELPTPVYVRFEDHSFVVTIWFDFCGHFTNKVYVFSSVGDLLPEVSEDVEEEQKLSERALNHLAFLKFPEELTTSNEKIFTDAEEGVSLCQLLSNLQRNKGELKCEVILKHKDDLNTVVATAHATLGHVLITRLALLNHTGA